LKEKTYTLKITDKNGKVIEDVEVAIGDMAITTPKDGKAEFPISISVPNTISVKKDGYITVSELGYEPKEGIQNSIILYEAGENLHTVDEAIYSIDSENLCKSIMKISTSESNCSEFDITCSTIGNKDTIKKYQLCQNNNVIAESDNGFFSGL
jgi:hypothetical protein